MPDRNESWEFRFTLSTEEVECEYDSPGNPRQRMNPEPLRTGANGSRLETITVLEQWLKRWEWIAAVNTRDQRGSEDLMGDRQLLVPDTFKVLGNQLYWLAMNNAAGMALIDSLSKRDRHVRLRISFKDGAEDLAAHPWEFLHDPDGDRFLAAETSLVLGRYLADEGHSAPIRCADNKVRVLFIVSLPEHSDYADERLKLRDLLDKLDREPKLKVESLNTWNANEVMAKIAGFTTGEDAGPVDVVHFIGLCKLDGGSPKLNLPSESGQRAWMDPKTMVEALTDNADSQPALVVLHLSDSQSDVPAHFERVAPHFVKRGISAVMAMQYPMAPKSGWEFVESLYGELAKGALIGEAVQATRKRLRLLHPHNRHFGTPVLYMQSKVDGALIRRIVGIDSDNDAVVQAVTDKPGTRAPDPTPRTIDVKGRLFVAIDRLPVSDIRNEVDDWVAKQLWPPDLDSARSTLRQEKRNFSALAGPVFDEMLKEVSALLTEGSQ